MRARRAIHVRRARNAEETYATVAHVVVGPVVARQRRTCASFLTSLLGTPLYAARRSLRCFAFDVFDVFEVFEVPGMFACARQSKRTASNIVHIKHLVRAD